MQHYKRILDAAPHLVGRRGHARVSRGLNSGHGSRGVS
jgi:hypothetical protein